MVRRMSRVQVPLAAFDLEVGIEFLASFFVILLSNFLTNSNVTKMLQAILVQMLQKSREKNARVHFQLNVKAATQIVLRQKIIQNRFFR